MGHDATDSQFTGQRQTESLGLYHMGARWYDPYLGRWLSPDSIVPDPANPQSLNRCSFVLGNPLKYIDPMGHKEEGECGYNGESCAEEPIVDEQISAVLESMSDWINDPNRTEPIVIPIGTGYVVIMPVGADPLQARPEWLQEASTVVTGIGVFVDYIEIMTLVAGAPADLAGGADIAVAGIGNLMSGDMWIYGKPDPSLPPLFLAGQDVLWTTGADFAVPWGMFGATTALTADPVVGAGAKTLTDLGTTMASFIYDWGRVEGTPTVLNAGFSIEGQPFVLFYP